MPAIVIEATWAAAGATVIIYLAALLGVAPELYDAAEVDGASIWQKIRYITLPSIRTILFVTLILQLIATAQLFTEPLLFTGGGPNNATLTVLLLIYRYAFQNSLGGDYGMAAALSLMLAAFLATLHRRLLLADPIVERRIVMRRRRRDRPCGPRRCRTRGIMGRADWRQRRTSWTMRGLHITVLVFLLVVGLGPILWMLKSSVTPTQDTLRAPMALWPHGIDLSQLATAWTGPTSTATCATRWSSRSGRGRSRSSWRRRPASRSRS